MVEKKEISVWINGFKGRMGQSLNESIENKDVEGLRCVGGSDIDLPLDKSILSKIDAVLDFSSIKGNKTLFSFLKENNAGNKTILIGTTGLSKEDKEAWKILAKNNRVMIAANTSIGIISLAQVLMKVSSTFSQGFYIEIEEAHHRNKVDAPSGTALLLAESILKVRPELHVNTDRNKKREDNEIGIVSIRGGGIFGCHSVSFLGDEEEICFSHRANSRKLFVKGALKLLKWLDQKDYGFYSVFDIDF